MNFQPLILLVDDDPDQLELYTLLLEEMGCWVTCARDGQEALPLALELRPDLIITDVYMPGMNGLELCQRVRANERLRMTPLIIHSSERIGFIPRGEVFLRKDGDLSRLRRQVVLSLGAAQEQHTGPP